MQIDSALSRQNTFVYSNLPWTKLTVKRGGGEIIARSVTIDDTEDKRTVTKVTAH